LVKDWRGRPEAVYAIRNRVGVVRGRVAEKCVHPTRLSVIKFFS
jgi:hypothetical protein